MNNCQRGYAPYQQQMQMQRPANPNMFVPVSKPMSRNQLLNYINEVSFAVTDCTLYLDTHPYDQEALAYCQKHIKMREAALNEYARCYGPLTIDTAADSCADAWKWVLQPWPWEGGVC